MNAQSENSLLAAEAIRTYLGFMFIETEQTPNPSSLKFLPGRTVMPAGTREFASPEAAIASPLAEAIFNTGEVENVFFGYNFVTVTAGPGADWSALKPEVVTIVLDHFVSEAPLFADGDGASTGAGAEEELVVEDKAEDAEVIASIHELLESRVRPAVASDGGDIAYRGFSEGVVYLTLQGACAGCPSSTMTLKQGIESLLKHYVPEVTEVRAT